MENLMMIKAESRKEVGKKIAKKLRNQGQIPAIIYGAKKESIPIALSQSDVKAILKTEKGENTVVKIQRDNLDVDAMLKEVQYDYLSETIIHADFIRIDLNIPVTVSVPIVTRGEPIGVKTEDGFFDFMTREVKIRCLPTQIPSRYVVDAAPLHVGQSIKAEDLELGEDIKLLSDSHTVICAVTGKAREEEPEEEVAAEGAEAEAADETAEKPAE
jgi:large subunit ribosomal protein L25